MSLLWTRYLWLYAQVIEGDAVVEQQSAAVTRDSGCGGVSRRAVVSAAWAAPVVLAATAAPRAAASTNAQVDLVATARHPIDSDGSHNSLAYYEGPRLCDFTFTFANEGPDVLPAGSRIELGVPFPSIWNLDSLTIVSSGAQTLVPAGRGTVDITTGDNPTAYRQLFYFTVTTPVPVGAFNVNFTIQMNGTQNTATNFYYVRTTARFTPGVGANDIDPGNNADFADNYAYYNHAPATTP
ncbi:hypothetical protein PTQ19_14540 [Microbacterium esteraromaticum]|uniref:hypothetical protein n=1 Tax=Microbacterium esteraromaticum TaxID=57043 RepID=UPI00236899E6|nr:hypothetical protein [Microbacterium esteraromaticum]WDH78710.1 hypothetical protein PTQ19_14540 [Microbacterium esteraromaticum]